MNRPVMFNGRLNKNEADIWLDLLEETSNVVSIDRYLAKQFLGLSDSISFVSSVEDHIIGGTTIYRDRTRLSMVLASVAVKDTYRETAAFQIIKSSLPFFKTVAIRDVDVLISSQEVHSDIGFPLSLEVDPWAADAIRRAGFGDIAKIRQCSFEPSAKYDTEIKWDKNPDLERAKELIWDQSKPSGLTNSLVWVAKDFAASQGALRTSSIDGETVIVAGFWKVGLSLVISPIVSNPESIEWSQVAKAIVTEGVRLRVDRIHLPLIGEGQSGLIEEIEGIANLSSSRKLSLLRKPL
ncbi:MAG: hypothetical protein ACFFEE_11550 [Candidatus Thorarchaeota archaeon]